MLSSDGKNFNNRYDTGNNYYEPTTLELLRNNLIIELKTINQYERDSRITTNRRASNLFEKIADDERYHVAELMHLIMELDPRQKEEMMREMEKRRRPGM